jgi:hypothetical protein
MLTIHVPFSSWLITSDFSETPIAFCQLFICIVLGDVDLCFSVMLVRKANAVEQET